MDQLPGVVGEWLEREYGGRYTYTSDRITLTTANQVILPNDPERVIVIFMNLSVETARINPEAASGPGIGLILGPSGGSLTLNIRQDFVLPSLEWNGRVDANTGILSYVTIRRYAKSPNGVPDASA